MLSTCISYPMRTVKRIRSAIRSRNTRPRLRNTGRKATVIVESVAYARAGLAGNPSDGYFGKCIAVIVKDFSARVWLEPHDRIEIIPSPEDRPAYASLDDFMHEIQLHGFYGAERL